MSFGKLVGAIVIGNLITAAIIGMVLAFVSEGRRTDMMIGNANRDYDAMKTRQP